MQAIPQGMSQQTFDYLLAFTTDHEGDTPFMYNNWSAKNENPDVTIGVGHALTSLPKTTIGPGQFTCAAGEGEAASVRTMFRVRATGQPPSRDQMIAEFRRVYNTERIGGNLFSAFQAPSPLEMDRDAMLDDLRDKMLYWWARKGHQDFPDFAAIPAQAQVALMSYNYGARLSSAPLMCDAVRANSYTEAAKQSSVPGWYPKKVEAHKRLFLNAAVLILGKDVNMLPPIFGPFQPPPAAPLPFPVPAGQPPVPRL